MAENLSYQQLRNLPICVQQEVEGGGVRVGMKFAKHLLQRSLEVFKSGQHTHTREKLQAQKCFHGNMAIEGA